MCESRRGIPAVAVPTAVAASVRPAGELLEAQLLVVVLVRVLEALLRRHPGLIPSAGTRIPLTS